MITSSVGPIDLVTFFVAIVLPLVNGFLTKQTWSPALRGTLLAALALIAGLSNELLASMNAGEAFDIGLALIKFGGVFVVAVASYFGILSRAIHTPAEVASIDLTQLSHLELSTMAEQAGVRVDPALTVGELSDLMSSGPQLEIITNPPSIASIVASKGVR